MNAIETAQVIIKIKNHQLSDISQLIKDEEDKIFIFGILVNFYKKDVNIATNKNTVIDFYLSAYNNIFANSYLPTTFVSIIFDMIITKQDRFGGKKEELFKKLIEQSFSLDDSITSRYIRQYIINTITMMSLYTIDVYCNYLEKLISEKCDYEGPMRIAPTFMEGVNL